MFSFLNFSSLCHSTPAAISFVFIYQISLFFQPDSPSHSTTSTNDYYGDLDEFVGLPQDNPKHNNKSPTGKTGSSIYSTYPPNGIHKHKKKHPSILLNNQLLDITSEHASKEEGFEAFGEASDGDETTSIHSDYSTPDKE